MNKVILTIATVLVVSFANGQEKETSGNDVIKFGVKAGVNFANLTASEDLTMKVGFHIGGFMEYKLSKKFTLQPELLYSTQGAKYQGSDALSGYIISGESNYKLAYLNLPVMAKYYVSSKFSLEAGPQIGFLLSAKNEFDYSGTLLGEPISESGEVDIKDDFNAFDYGINFGAGYDFNDKISLGLRYNLGLSDVSDFYYFDKNSVIQLSLGYKF
ncbi:porin family protein [Flavobacterium sp. RSB2_4_14]|uniref:porin family protein n=1 Tax=Flavobacterium sp. RSB2_4_14 TaxID=3447665 RepID=UPI003F3DF15F